LQLVTINLLYLPTKVIITQNVTATEMLHVTFTVTFKK